jgi:hypothetical protein
VQQRNKGEIVKIMGFYNPYPYLIKMGKPLHGFDSRVSKLKGKGHFGGSGHAHNI